MKPTTKYVIQTGIKFGALEKIDIDALQKACTHEKELGTLLDFVTLAKS